MNQQSQRYSRQILFAGIGKEGQKKLANAHVVLLGCGALGSIQAEILARAGVGRLTLLDRDILEASNLQRQLLYSEKQAEQGLPKVIAAKQRLQEINSEVEVDSVIVDIDYKTIEKYVKDADLILDATDNFEARFLLNDACIKYQKPWVYGACVGSYGLTMTIIPGQTPCLRCLFDTIPTPGTAQTCDTAGVIGPIVTVIASMQCAEALKILVGTMEDLRKGLFTIDLWDNRHLNLGMKKPLPDCPACQKQDWSYLAGSEKQRTTVLCGRDTVQVTPSNPRPINLQQLAEQLSPLGDVHHNPYLLRFQTEEVEMTVFQDGRALIKGTAEPKQARSIYARYLGN